MLSITYQVSVIEYAISSIICHGSYFKHWIPSIRYQVSDINHSISSLLYQVFVYQVLNIEYKISSRRYQVFDINYQISDIIMVYFQTQILVQYKYSKRFVQKLDGLNQLALHGGQYLQLDPRASFLASNTLIFSSSMSDISKSLLFSTSIASKQL